MEDSFEQETIPEQFSPKLRPELQNLEIEVDDMMNPTNLNPEAKEFVPISPTRTTDSTSPFSNGEGIIRNMNHLIDSDSVVAQSPRKGDFSIMDDNITLPSENEFDHEVSKRPHETQIGVNGRGESPGSISFEELNTKEKMQKDDKLDFELKDELEVKDGQSDVSSTLAVFGDETIEDLQPDFHFEQLSSLPKLDDAMSRSFMEGRDTNILSENACDLLNKVQDLPLFEDEMMETNGHSNMDFSTAEADFGVENETVEADLMYGFNSQPDIVQAAQNVANEVNLMMEQASAPVEEAMVRISFYFSMN